MAPREASYTVQTAAQQQSGSEDSCPINRLNTEVKRKLKLEKVPVQLVDAPEAISAAQGTPVYHRRVQSLVWLYTGASLAALGYAVFHNGAAYAAAALVLAWVVVDFYGAVLHVVLDHSPFIPYPIIGAGALEFQWHHAIPHDITSKPFVEVCGDLNYVAALHIAWHFLLNGGPMGNMAGNVCAAAKILLAYFGQYSHRMAHMSAAKRPAWVGYAQSLGIMVSPELHKEHHTTYNDGFPILSGLTAPVIAWMVKVMPDRHAWLALFAIMSLADIWVMNNLLNAVFNAIGAPIPA